MTITPDQAQTLLDAEEGGDATPLLMEARHLAQTIAGMEGEWGYQKGGVTYPTDNERQAREWVANIPNARLVRRLVGPVEEAE